MSTETQNHQFNIGCEQERYALQDELDHIEAVYGRQGRHAYVMGKARATQEFTDRLMGIGQRAGEALERISDKQATSTIPQGISETVGG